MTMELSPCLDLLFGDGDPQAPLETRIRRASAAGFRWAEMWGWSQRDLGAINEALDATGLRLNCLTIDPFVPLVDPGARMSLLESVRRSTQVAADLGCRFVVVLAGDTTAEERSIQHQAIVDGLRQAGPLAEASGVNLLLENLNSRIDHVGHYLDSTTEALDIVEEVGHPSVRMLYDLYHSVTMGERPEVVLAGRFDLVAHVQIADVPGRHEPGSGTIHWPATIDWLRASEYTGRLGLEFIPSADTLPSVAYIRGLVL
jgi:hydroxypyruvate isomerase